MKRREELSFFERIYIVEVIKGVFITSGHFLKNFATFLLQQVGLLKNSKSWVTVEYPDALQPFPERFRGRHRLTLNEEGSVRCTACFLCATACPANCIYIEAAEHDDKKVEKFPRRYEIDTLLCIYCGYCVEACPVDAIRMDSGLHPEVYYSDPRAYIEDKEVLMLRSKAVQTEGPDVLIKNHLEKIKKIESQPFSD